MNLLSFPFYESISRQDRFRKSGLGEGFFGQITSQNRFPPFQIMREKTGQLLDCIHIYHLDGSLYKTVYPPVFPYKLLQSAYNDFILYYGATIPGLLMPCGMYYLEVGGFYSEIFDVRVVTLSLVTTVWQNTKPLGGIMYGEGFFQSLILDTEILEPDYRFEEEGDLNGDEVFIRDSAKVSKLRLLESGGVPEYLVDALNAVPLHDDVVIGEFDQLGKITAKTAWLKGAKRGNVTLTFEEEQPILWQQCAEEIVLTEVDQTGFVPDVSACNGGPSIRPVWSDTGDVRCKQVEYWASAEISAYVTNNTCLMGGLPQSSAPVMYRIAAGRFESLVSQQDADDQAQTLFDANSQAFANTNGVCVGDYVFAGGGPDGLNFYLNVFRVGSTVGPLVVTVDLLPNNRPAVRRTMTILNGSTSTSGSVAVDGQAYTQMNFRIISTNPASYAFAL